MTYRSPDDRDPKREARAEEADAEKFRARLKAARWNWTGPYFRSLGGCLLVIAALCVVGGVLFLAAMLWLQHEFPDTPIPKCVPDGDGGWTYDHPVDPVQCVHHYCPPCGDRR